MRKLDDLGLDGGGKAAAPSVDLGQPLQVRLHPGPGVDRPRSELNLGLQLFVLDRLVTLEHHPVDDRVLEHADDQNVTLLPNGHVREQTGCEQALEGLVDRVAIECVSGSDREVRPHGIRLDALVALHLHGLDHPLLSRGRTDPDAEDDDRQPDEVSHRVPFSRRCRSRHLLRSLGHEVRPMMSFVVTHTIKAITSVSPTIVQIC